MNKIFLYNTLTRKKEEFIPIKEGEVGIYTCGPTVYNFAHIGNLRTFIFEDVLKKTLKLQGYKVYHVMNITDVGHLTGDNDDGEDKIEKAARERNSSINQIVDFYTNAFLKDINDLNIEKADVMCKASQHIKEMIDLIERIEKNGHTYVSDGNVYFSIDSINDYGKLACLTLDNLQSGKRVDIDTAKKNPHDFVLWFTKSKFQDQAMKWDSKWGVGYPGWHIECSAMSMKYLGETFDIHCGGVDAIPVHHTNEIAQSEAATGKKWVNYWLHGEFLLSQKGKMSKSSGEFTTLSSLSQQGINPLAYRLFCLQSHYRKQLQFSPDAVLACQTSLENLYNKIDNIRYNISKNNCNDNDSSRQNLSKFIEEFNLALCDDLSTTKAVSVLNRVVSADNITDIDKLEFVKIAEKVFSLDLLKDRQKKENNIDNEIIDMANARLEAKKKKDFNLADSIRKEIIRRGYDIKDTKDGFEISKK